MGFPDSFVFWYIPPHSSYSNYIVPKMSPPLLCFPLTLSSLLLLCSPLSKLLPVERREVDTDMLVSSIKIFWLVLSTNQGQTTISKDMLASSLMDYWNRQVLARGYRFSIGLWPVFIQQLPMLYHRMILYGL